MSCSRGPPCSSLPWPGLLQETLEEHPVVVTDGEELRVVQLPPGHHPQPLVEAFKVGGIDYSVLVVVEEVLEEVSELLHLEGGEEAADLGPVHVPLRPLGHKALLGSPEGDAHCGAWGPLGS